jgi:hypothetical protein
MSPIRYPNQLRNLVCQTVRETMLGLGASDSGLSLKSEIEAVLRAPIRTKNRVLIDDMPRPGGLKW